MSAAHWTIVAHTSPTELEGEADSAGLLPRWFGGHFAGFQPTSPALWLRAALARLHAHVVAHPRDAALIAQHIYLSVASFPGVPDEFSFVNQFDDAFTLARDGTFGDEDTVRREFTEVLRRFVAEC